MYTITHQCVEAIISHMNAHYPYESCGIIAAPKYDKQQLQYFYPIKNDHINARHHFTYNASDWVHINYELLNKEQVIACYIHSHVDAAPTLSNEDLEGITDYNALQAIIHYTKKNSPSLYFYRYNDSIKQFEHYSLTFT